MTSRPQLFEQRLLASDKVRVAIGGRDRSRHDERISSLHVL